MQDKILILDFGSQFTQLIARRIRELQVYCEIVPFNKPLQPDPGVRGIILSGSPASVRQPEAPTVQLEALQNLYATPVLGVCYGAQLMAQQGGGEVAQSNHREYGRALLETNATHSPLLEGIDTGSQVWMSHADSIVRLPDQYQVTATTSSIPVAAFQHRALPVFGIQFHPEVTHSIIGPQLLYNFVHTICGLQPNWTPEGFVEATVRELQTQIGSGSVVCALSGGVDSTVAALLLHKAIGPRLHCIFVDNGLLRLHEYEQVLEQYQGMGLNVVGVDARRRFLDPLAGVSDPEIKRKTIGRVFIEVFEAEAKRLEATEGHIQFLAQGTIYPDVIESVSVLGPSVTIKSHHNVGGLPARMNMQVVEPLRMLFKDEVRRVGRTLGISPGILGRHPFPGPGLAIRVLGAVSQERLDILQQADHIYLNILRERGLYDQIWQAFSVLLPVQSVGVMGDERTYENVLALRAVTSQDGMTADWFPMPYDALADISSQIITRVKGINRVVYDVSSKPPATIEWE